MSVLRVSLITWAALLAGGIGPFLLVYDLTTHSKGQQGNLPGFVPAVQQPPTFIGPATLAGLTVDFVQDARAEQTLLGYVSAASGAAADGDLPGLTAAMDNYIAAITDGTSNTLMVGERMPMTPADAWTLEALARAWVTPLR